MFSVDPFSTLFTRKGLPLLELKSVNLTKRFKTTMITNIRPAHYKDIVLLKAVKTLPTLKLINMACINVYYS